MKLNPFRRPATAAQVDAATRKVAQGMVRRADAARDTGSYFPAAYLYAEAVALLPHRADLHVQAGHMFKEAGDLRAAERHYATAAERLPRDADLALQLGHFFKKSGRLGEAVASYRRALDLDAGNLDAAREIEAITASGWRGKGVELPSLPGDTACWPGSEVLASDVRALNLAPEIAPRPIEASLRNYGNAIEIRQLGRRERTFWGTYQTLRGVEAIQGFCISDKPILTLSLLLNGMLIHRGSVRGGYPLPHEANDPDKRKYVFNVWLDLSDFAEQRYELQYVAQDVDGRLIGRTEWIVIAPPLALPSLPESDSDVPRPDPADPRSLDDQINARPSMVRPARRALMKEPPRTILVSRPDVLGDLVVSVPALRRLRALFPAAHIVGIVSKANRDLAETLGFFDEMVETEMPFNHWEQRRVVPLETQKALAQALSRWSFDIAIDLCAAGESRLLLPLSGAPLLVGFRCGELPGMSVEVTGATVDQWNGHDNVPHTNKALAMIEWLGAMMRSDDNLVPRELDRGLLDELGLGRDERYVVLHAGGRWDFSQWPHYAALAQMLIDHTDLSVVLLANDPAWLGRMPEAVTGSGRFHFLARRLSFDQLDALVSFPALFIGDDSGVKHLSALRGTKVIGIQNARNNWNEWGHENEGFIITRQLPCAGCQIQHYPESLDCGRDFICITAIKPDEVFEAARRLIQADG